MRLPQSYLTHYYLKERAGDEITIKINVSRVVQNQHKFIIFLTSFSSKYFLSEIFCVSNLHQAKTAQK